MTLQINPKSSGFRELSSNELDAVSGGNETQGNPITVTADRINDGWVSVSAEDLALLGIFGWGPDIVEPAFFGDGGGGSGLPPMTTIPDADKAGCPPGMTCTPVEGANDMFVRGSDGKLYLSPNGVERAQTGADTDWWGVAIDLAKIVAGGLGGIGAGVLGVIAGMIGIAADTLEDLWYNT